MKAKHAKTEPLDYGIKERLNEIKQEKEDSLDITISSQSMLDQLSDKLAKQQPPLTIKTLWIDFERNMPLKTLLN